MKAVQKVTPQRIGYRLIRKAGPSEDDQLAALRAGGVQTEGIAAPVWTDKWRERRRNNAKDDPLPERKEMISRLRTGDVVVVHSPGCLAITSADARQTMVQIVEKGASIFIASSGEMLKSEPAVAAWFRVADEVTPAVKRIIAAKMREHQKESGHEGAAKQRFTAAQYRRAKPIWRRQDMTISEKVALIHETIAPISQRMLAHKFGRSTKEKGK